MPKLTDITPKTGIEVIQKQVDAIPKILDKITFLIECRLDLRMKYDISDKPIFGNLKSKEYYLLRDINALIEKYEHLSKHQTTTGTEPPPAQKHSFPTINKTKYNSDLIFEKFNNVLFECSKDCFNAWLVNGYNHKETIKYICTGRLSANTGQKALNFAQLRKFINMITGDCENTKDAYYSAVFGLKIKTSSVKPSNQFKLNRDLRLCEI